MKVVCVSDDGMRRVAIVINPMTHLLIPACLVTLVLLVLSFNSLLGLPQLRNTPPAIELSEPSAQSLMHALEHQLGTVSELKQAYANYTVDVDTLSSRLGTLEAEVSRLNALGQRIALKAKLDPSEFDLDNPPSRGGYDTPANIMADKHASAKALVKDLTTSELAASRQNALFASLDTLLDGRHLIDQSTPNLAPTEAGYVSSKFGTRRDPFTGAQRQHAGVDFAGPTGTSIFSVAGGVVSFVGQKGGYGNVVEIDHGNGLKSRYGHLKMALVDQGALVNKGDWIALMGSTGRSTGSHLHLEIIKDGQQIDPLAYLNLAK